MSSFQVPFQDENELYTLMKKKNIIIPVMKWNNKTYMRISINGYNTSDDISTLIDGLSNLGL